MTALGIRYLTGCSVGADMTRQRPEFPPHPGRIFMAMAATYFETKGDPEERQALEWLEQQDAAPHISAPEFSERRSSQGRLPVEAYVPVNDRHDGIVRRGRQPRSFPTVRLYGDTVFLVWHVDAPEEVQAGLDRLCFKVTRIGHSSSLVQMWREEEPENIEPNLAPDEFFSETRMRVPERGTLAYLEKAFENAERPRLARWQGYRRWAKENMTPVVDSVFDSRLIVLAKTEGRVLGLESTPRLSNALRNAAMKALPEGEAPEWLSGHRSDGSPSTKPHAAFCPLPFVGTQYADGHVLGMAMAIPRVVSAEEMRRVVGALLFDPETGEERPVKLWDQDALWRWELERETRDRPPTALRADTWTKASYVWASVTPVVLHHYPKKNREDDVQRILLEAFASAGLPKPKALRVCPASHFIGAPHAREIPSFTDKGTGLCRYQTHVTVEFEEKVTGPMLVGRGRYRGYGLFRPIESGEERSR